MARSESALCYDIVTFEQASRLPGPPEGQSVAIGSTSQTGSKVLVQGQIRTVTGPGIPE